jgi:hypothetical protein
MAYDMPPPAELPEPFHLIAGNTFGNRPTAVKASAVDDPCPPAVKVGSGSSWAEPRCHAKGRNRPVSPVAPRRREGPLTEPTAGVQPWPRERVLMPHSRHSIRARRSALLGGKLTFTDFKGQGKPRARFLNFRTKENSRCASIRPRF